MRTQRKSKKSDSASKLVLEEIIGLTTKNANGLSSNMLTGDCVYLAGCVVVIYNVESGDQSHLVASSRMPKPLTCVAVSNQNGGIVAAGESGHKPAVLVWDYSTRTLLAELKVHRYGVAFIAFSPNGKHLISVGFPHDGYLCLWDWRNGRLVTKIKSSSSCSVISSVIFSSDANFFVTAGKKHMKFWTVGPSLRSVSNVGAGLPAMDGKSANLGCKKGSSFISVASATWTVPIPGRDQAAEFYPIYALTDTGLLCLLGSGFSMKKWVDLKVEKGFALSVSNKLIACACNNGVVQLFAIETLMFAGSLQYSELQESHNSRDMTCDSRSSEKHFQSYPTIPDAIACQFVTSEKLVVVYGNRSLYVWDVRDVAKVSRCSVLVSHGACIWDVKNLSCENMHDPTLACVARGCCGGVSFATCSTDGTIRLWDLALRLELKQKNERPEVAIGEHVDGNSIDAEKFGSIHLVSAGIFERDIVESGVSTQGFRAMAVSSDGKYLAAGDCQGNLHVYNLNTADYTCIQDAHEAEILSLTFTLSSKNSPCPGRYLLASGGRDRMIHLYDVERNLELIGSLDDHSAAVTAVELTCNGCKILSCSADRSLVFRDVAITDSGCNISRCHHQIASNGTVYDMAIDPATEVAVTVGQDKKINTFSISTGKHIKTFKQDTDFGEPLKVSIDPSSSYLVCSFSNKSMCIYDLNNGELVTQVVGHGEVITGVVFLPDCKHIISVGGDGCIFVWKLPSFMSSRMLHRIMERVGPLSPTSTRKKGVSSGSILYEKAVHPFDNGSKDFSVVENFDQDYKKALFVEASDFRFSISRLPNWAKTKVTPMEILPTHSESTSSQQEELEYHSSSTASNDETSVTEDPPSCHQDLGASKLCSANISKSQGITVHTPLTSSSASNDETSVTEDPPSCHRDLGASKLCSADISKSQGITVHTPCKPDLGGSKLCPKSSCDSDFSTSPSPHDIPSFAMDKRWLTVHTVYYPDLLDSPQERKFEDVRDSASSPNICEDEDMEIKSGDPTITNQVSEKSFCGPNSQGVNIGEFPMLSEQVRDGNLCENNLSGSCDAMTCCAASAEKLQLDPGEISKDDLKNSNQDDDDLFSKHFSNLSTSLKIEGRRSARRSYSARFIVRRDHFTGGKILFETSNQNSDGALSVCSDVIVPHVSYEDQTTRVVEESQPSDASKQDLQNSTGTDPACSLQQSGDVTDCMVNGPITEEGTNDNSISKETEMQKKLTECKEALLTLDACAGDTLHLFSGLESLSNREAAPSAPGVEIYDWAAKLIPIIREKLVSLGDMVQSRSSCPSAKLEDSRTEPLLEKFAERLSRQVLDLVKKSL